MRLISLWLALVLVIGGLFWLDNCKGAESNGPLLLNSFEDQTEFALVEDDRVIKLSFSKEHATHKNQSLKAIFPGSSKDTWPMWGMNFEGIDLNKYRELRLDIYNSATQTVTLGVRIEGFTQLAHMNIILPGGLTTTARIPMERIEELGLSINEIANIFFFVGLPREECTLFFDNFRLVGHDSKDIVDQERFRKSRALRIGFALISCALLL
jgi:hypothetical protein